MQIQQFFTPFAGRSSSTSHSLFSTSLDVITQLLHDVLHEYVQAIASCTLDPAQAAYVISVETPVPLDLVLLHSSVHMDLLESNDADDLGQASPKIQTSIRAITILFGSSILATGDVFP